MFCQKCFCFFCNKLNSRFKTGEHYVLTHLLHFLLLQCILVYTNGQSAMSHNILTCYFKWTKVNIVTSQFAQKFTESVELWPKSSCLHSSFSVTYNVTNYNICQYNFHQLLKKSKMLRIHKLSVILFVWKLFDFFVKFSLYLLVVLGVLGLIWGSSQYVTLLPVLDCKWFSAEPPTPAVFLFTFHKFYLTCLLAVSCPLGSVFGLFLRPWRTSSHRGDVRYVYCFSVSPCGATNSTDLSKEID